MNLPNAIGMIGATFAFAVALMGAFYLGKDIFYPGFLYKAIFTSWFSGIVFFRWATGLLISYNISVRQQIIDKIDSVVIDAHDLTETEIELAVDGLGGKKGKASDYQVELVEE